MQPEEQRAERSRDLERVLTYVDAIAAVAITLLILPLVDLAGEIRSEHDSVSALIRSHAGEFWGFALSFVVIARLWFSQHRLMRPVVTGQPASSVVASPLDVCHRLPAVPDRAVVHRRRAGDHQGSLHRNACRELVLLGFSRCRDRTRQVGPGVRRGSAGGPGRSHRRSFCRGACGFASRSIDRLLPAAPLGGHAMASSASGAN